MVDIIIAIVSGISTCIAIVLWWLLRNLYKSLTDRVYLLEGKMDLFKAEMDEIKENYLDRFEKTWIHTGKSKDEIIKVVHALQISMAHMEEKIILHITRK